MHFRTSLDSLFKLISYFSCYACSFLFLKFYYIFNYLFTLFSHVLLLCLLGPRKRSSGSGPESGPQARVRAPKGSERSAQDSSGTKM